MNTTPPGGYPSRRSVLQTAGAAALVVPAAALLGGCATADSGSGDAAAGKVAPGNPLGVKADAPLDVVVFKGGYGDDYAKYHESLYAEKYPQAKVSHTATAEIQTELQPRFVAGNPPDVIDNSGSKKMPLGTLVSDGQLADMADLLAAASLDDPKAKVADTLLPGALDSVTFDGKVMAIPYVYTAYGFWYSRSLFAKNNWTWPTTWDGLVALAGEIKKAGIAPFAYGGTKAPDYFYYALFALAAKEGGEDVLKEIDNLKPGAWQSEPMKAAAKAIEGLVKAGFMLKGSEGLDHTQAQTAWVQGQAAIYPSGSWIENEMKSISPAGFDMVFGAVPPLTAGGKLPISALHVSAGENFVVPSKAKNLLGGKEFLRVMLSKKAAARFSELTHAPTIVKGATTSDFGSTAFGSVNKAIADAGKNVFAYRFNTWYADLHTVVKSEIANLLAGRSDAATFLAKSQAKADAIAADSSVKKFTR
ncbi:N-acetylglucosamine/diacetylchitobiose ABC transporter substrate-binding protein [Longispora sp. K20-0274]|uniref:N-acetylglucosamine/diacetylchitobiose ABC transporter substrate-binding protein n=1 Tax=Longispora sp. K20-0274 TaxID=3088255 RepID=UPI00399AE822